MKTSILQIKESILAALAILISFMGFSQPIANFTAVNTTICVGGSVQFTNLSTGATAFNWSFSDGTGVSQSSSLMDPVITYSNPGVFTVSLNALAAPTGFDNEVKTGYITVLSTATATLTSAPGSNNQTICLGDPFDTITYILQGAQGATFTGLPPGVFANVVPDTSGAVITITGFIGTAGSYPFSFTTTANVCAPITVSGSITVEALPTISLTSGNPNQVVCINTAATDVSFTIGGVATGATVNGLPPGMSSTFSMGVITVSGTPSVAGPFPFTVSTIGGVCPPATFPGVINVDPYLALISAPGTDNQSVCASDSIVEIAYAVGAGYTGVTITPALPPGLNGNFFPGLYTISGSSNTVGNVTYTLNTVGGPCGPSTANLSIEITGPPTLSLTSGVFTDTQSVCVGAPITNIEYTVGGSGTGAVAIGLPTGIVQNLVGNILTISGATNQLGVNPFIVITTGSLCGTDTLFGQISVDTFAVIELFMTTLSDTQQVCVNSSIDSIFYRFSGSATGALGINLPFGVNVTVQGDTVIVSDTATSPGIYPFIIYTTGGACPADSAYGLLTVDDSLGLQLISPFGSDNQILCDNNNNTIDTIIYVFTGGADTVVVTGLPPGVTDTVFNDTLRITGAPTSAGTFTYSMVLSGAFCPNDTLTGTIEVQTAEITLLTAPYTNDQLVCINTPIDSISYAVGGSVLVLDLPPGVTSTYTPGAPNVLTISGTPTAPGSNYYTLQFSGPCGNSIAVGYLTVSDGVKNFVAGPDTTINLGQSVDLFAVGDNLLTYLWTPDTTLSNPIIFNPSATPDVTTTYTVTVVDENDCSASLPVTITILTNIELFVPNLFSPNGDGFNDKWEIPNLGLFPNTGVTVINREGQVVYENTAYDNSWDGTFKGDNLPEATYYYVLDFAAQDQLIKGAVTILRNEK